MMIIKVKSLCSTKRICVSSVNKCIKLLVNAYNREPVRSFDYTPEREWGSGLFCCLLMFPGLAGASFLYLAMRQ